MPAVRIADGKLELNYRDTGGGPAIVLIHGFPFSSRLWDPQLESLAERYRVIAPDLRGFGATQLAPEPYSMARLADDVLELLDALAVERAVVGGLSMGGYVSFEFVRRHPQRVAALVLADTRPEPDTPEARTNRARMAQLAVSAGSRPVTDELIPRLLAPATRARAPDVERRLRTMMESAPPQALADALMAMAERADSRPLLPQIKVPTLVIGGLEDQLTPPAETIAWARSLPNGTVQFIEDAGHVSNLEQPGAFNSVLLDFLAEHAEILANQRESK